MQERFDVVIVGAGPAGCVLAARLSEDPARRVLLLDAGPDYGPDRAAWPAELLEPYHSEVESHSWGYTQRADGAGRLLALPRARVVGGCSAINACLWYRGSRIDYDGWAAAGNPGWSYDDLEPYFRRAESDPGGRPGYHGLTGPVRISRAPVLSPLDGAMLETAAELGFPLLEDLNGSPEQIPCAGRTPKNVAEGVRWSAALSYLALARPRSNFTLRPETLARRVLCEDARAAGVEAADGQRFLAGEVIVSAGSYASPALLLRSGIGPPEHLGELGIPLVRALPGVGEHLMDHPFIAPYTSDLTTFPMRQVGTPECPSFIQAMIKGRSRVSAQEIDLHLYPRQKFDEERGRWLFGWGVSLQFARSLGRVRLASPDPAAAPLIDHNYFGDPLDLQGLLDAIELAFRLVETRPLADLVEPPRRRSRAELEAIVRAEVGTTFHPSSTCRMGPASDPGAVVDAEGRVHGVSGLRVVDASIFPSGPRCNLHNPVVAVAERMADVIRGRAPEDVV
ncbi:MAG TPA: GMC family oxidoreductase N-terminal domain-containing protein [Thermomicrobiaceae bacterium]|nr:GMC family oxidoreductase N-terminal domain-containing protein [Thermomicrobiaceae bacterium]